MPPIRSVQEQLYMYNEEKTHTINHMGFFKTKNLTLRTILNP